MTYLQLLSVPDYRRSIISRVSVGFGDGLFNVLAVLVAMSLDASPTTLGIVGFCLAFPRGVLSLLGGVLTDRLPHLRLLVSCDGLRMTAILIMGIMAFTGTLSILALCLGSAVVSATFAASMPASKAIVRDVVPTRDALTAANGLIQGLLWPSFFIGSGAGGAMMEVLDAVWIFVICATCFGVSAAFLRKVTLPCKPKYEKRAVSPIKSAINDLTSGYQELKSHNSLMVRIVSIFFWTIAWRGVVQVLLPLYVVQSQGWPSSYYGYMMLFCGAGELASALLVGKLNVNFNSSFKGEPLMVLSALALIIAGWIPGVMAITVTAAALLLIGLSAAMIDIPLITSIQNRVSRENIGKVFSFWETVSCLGGGAGALLVGVLISALGIENTLMILALILGLSSLVSHIVLMKPKILFKEFRMRNQTPIHHQR